MPSQWKRNREDRQPQKKRHFLNFFSSFPKNDGTFYP